MKYIIVDQKYTLLYYILLCIVQETRHKNQGLFKDFPAPNKFFPGPFVFDL